MREGYSLIAVREDKTIRDAFRGFCKRCGMTLSGTVHLLVHKVIAERQIPFSIVTHNLPATDTEPQMIMFNIGIDANLKQEFKEVCDTLGMSMARMIKLYMWQCITLGKIPFEYPFNE